LRNFAVPAQSAAVPKLQPKLPRDARLARSNQVTQLLTKADRAAARRIAARAPNAAVSGESVQLALRSYFISRQGHSRAQLEKEMTELYWWLQELAAEQGIDALRAALRQMRAGKHPRRGRARPAKTPRRPRRP
jgi:hypothetical protein